MSDLLDILPALEACALREALEALQAPDTDEPADILEAL
jgi:hypothetical protein